MKSIAVVAGSLLLSGCAAVTTTMDGIMSSWHGEPIESVIAQWGEPDRRHHKDDGEVYVWHDDRTHCIGIPDISGTSFSVNTSCDRILQTDAGGVVRAASWRGNDCPFTERGRYRNWRNDLAQSR